MGRVSLIKMNILLRLLYPLQMLPLWITQKVSCDMEKVFSKFIWRGKKPRLGIRTLQMPTDRGGLGFLYLGMS